MAEFLRPEPYADRQLRRWAGQWERARAATGLGGEPVLDRVFAWLTANRPPVPPPRVVHGDYGFANVMFDPAEDHSRASDSRLGADRRRRCAVRPRLADRLPVGGRPADELRADPIRSAIATCCPPCRPCPELIERYAQRSGDPGVAHITWYVTFAVTKLAVIVAGALNRTRPGRHASSAEPLHPDGARPRSRGRSPSWRAAAS